MFVRTPGGDTDFFNIVASVQQRDTLVPYMFIIYLEYLLRTSIDLMKENGLILEKARRRRYLARTTTDADYADDIALLANTPAQTESLLHNLERETGGIGLRVNSNKAEYMCFNQSDDISTLNGGSLKLEDEFTYQGNSVSSIGKDINMQQAEAWTAIDRLSVIWKSDYRIR